MQSCWAIGYGAAAIVVALILPRFGWRAVFLVGIVPALFTSGFAAASRSRNLDPRAPRLAHGACCSTSTQVTSAVASMSGLWFADDRAHADERGDDVRVVGTEFVDPVLSVAFPSSRAASACHTVVMSSVRRRHAGRHVVRLRDVRLRQRSLRPQADLRGVPASPPRSWSSSTAPCRTPVACSSCSGRSWRFSAPATSVDLAPSRPRSIPTSIRATAQGFTYNIGRLASADAPFVVGALAQEKGFGAAFHDDRQAHS